MSAVVEAPREMVEAVAALHLPARADRRLQILMDRNTNGALSPDESDHWKGYVAVGDTPVGRATSTMLDFNHPHRVRIRQAEALFGLFP